MVNTDVELLQTLSSRFHNRRRVYTLFAPACLRWPSFDFFRACVMVRQGCVIVAKGGNFRTILCVT